MGKKDKHKAAADAVPATPESDDCLISEVVEERGIKPVDVEPTAEPVSGLVDEPPPAVRTEYRPKFGAANRPLLLEKPFVGIKPVLIIGLLLWLGAFCMTPPAPCAAPALGVGYAEQRVFSLIAADDLYGARGPEEYAAALDTMRNGTAPAAAVGEGGQAPEAPASAEEKDVEPSAAEVEGEQCDEAAVKETKPEEEDGKAPEPAAEAPPVCARQTKAEHDAWRRFTLQGYMMMSAGLACVIGVVAWVLVRSLRVMPNFAPFIYAAVGACGVALAATVLAVASFPITKAPAAYSDSAFMYRVGYYTRYGCTSLALLVLAQLPGHHYVPPKDPRHPTAVPDPPVLFSHSASLLSMPAVLVPIAAFLPAVYAGKLVFFALAMGLALGLYPLTQEFTHQYRRPLTREEAMEYMTGAAADGQ
eukprot:TRINITY_DN9809_c0_g1_i1.p1 TRINITY_DN9809_c0_g1~~TRINITY_DN9809_c0_g1_i1.p1  ORF type:complete len:445 (+),score=151.71 TRINITY_DN9809_c0_g1_i1:82-1335(+)